MSALNTRNVMLRFLCYFFFNDTATTEIYTLSLHDALPISRHRAIRWHGLDLVSFREAIKRCDLGHFEDDELGTIMTAVRSEEHTSELQSRQYLVCRLLLEKKNSATRTTESPADYRPCSSGR